MKKSFILCLDTEDAFEYNNKVCSAHAAITCLLAKGRTAENLDCMYHLGGN